MGDSPPRARKGILVVDDNPDILDFMKAALEGAGYEVRTAAEGGEALALQRARRADVLITDIFMSGQEGFETIWRFKAEFPGTPIIAMSAGGGTGKFDVLSAAMLADVAATLPKPFAAERLLEAVRRVLSSSA